MNCDVVILLAILSYWSLNDDDVMPQLDCVRVDDKTLMMDYEGYFVSLVTPILYFKLWLIVIKS